MSLGPPVDPGLQPERTSLSWDRTGLSLVVAAVGVGRHAVGNLGPLVLVPCAVVVGCALWLRFVVGRRTRHARAHAVEAGFAVMHDGRLVAMVASLMGSMCVLESIAAVLRLLQDS